MLSNSHPNRANRGHTDYVQVVTASETLKSLPPLCYGQQQVAQATHLFVFCAAKDAPAAAERYIATRSLDTYAPEYAGMIRGSLAGQTVAWCAKQAYIALGFALAAAAEKRIASCPMEGFSAEGLQGALKIPDTHVVRAR